MRTISFLFLLVFGLMISSCSTVKVTASKDEKADFDTPKTFSMYPWDRQNDSIVSPIDKQTINNAIK